MSFDPVKLSKFLSFVLRHKPDSIGLVLDPQGWISIDDLIEKGTAAGTRFSRDDLLNVVETSDKKRFSVSADGQRIRAAQGHSVAVELGLPPREPPLTLYHGTATRFVESILLEGLKPQSRQQVPGHGATRRSAAWQAIHFQDRRPSHAPARLQFLSCRQWRVVGRSGAAGVPGAGFPLIQRSG